MSLNYVVNIAEEVLNVVDANTLRKRLVHEIENLIMSTGNNPKNLVGSSLGVNMSLEGNIVNIQRICDCPECKKVSSEIESKEVNAALDPENRLLHNTKQEIKSTEQKGVKNSIVDQDARNSLAVLYDEVNLLRQDLNTLSGNISGLVKEVKGETSANEDLKVNVIKERLKSPESSLENFAFDKRFGKLKTDIVKVFVEPSIGLAISKENTSSNTNTLPNKETDATANPEVIKGIIVSFLNSIPVECSKSIQEMLSHGESFINDKEKQLSELKKSLDYSL